MAYAVARLAGLTQAEIPSSVQRMMSGLPAHVTGGLPWRPRREHSGLAVLRVVRVAAEAPGRGRGADRRVTALTLPDAAAWLLDKACRACGTALPAPGDPCPACGVLSEVTSAEFAEQMERPGVLAAVGATRKRAEAMIDAALALHRDADAEIFRAELEDRRARAQGALEVAVA